MTANIVVVAEHFGGEVRPVTYELVACALEVQRFRPGPMSILVLGEEAALLAEEIAARSAARVLAVEIPGVKSYHGEAYKAILQAQLQEMGATHVCVAGTTQGLDFAPALAIRLGAACITGVERIAGGEEGLCFTRKIYNGKVVHCLVPAAPVTVFTVEPGTFRPASQPGQRGSVERRTVLFHPERCRSLGVEKSASGTDSGLAEAEVIVAAGRGIGKQENLPLIEQLAALFPRSAVAGSRPICDLGWMEYRQQVGITGNTVAPKVYIACGISGATQHLAGMRGSGFIVAINTDPEAALFNAADLCIVEDLTTFIPAVLAEHRKRNQP